MADVELLSKAIESFNSASSSLLNYYKSLEEKVNLLTEEVDHKKQLLNSILDSIDIGVVFFDSAGTVQLVNKAAERLLNVEADKLTGGTSIHASIQGETIIPENHKPFYALISNADVTDKDEAVIGRVLIFKDITRLKQLEAENERNRRLTAMGELVLKIAHEIRNPLGSIELFASLLSSDLSTTKHGDYANRISSSVRSLVTTLDNMLRYSKGIVPKLQDCDLGDLIREVHEEFKEMLSHKNIQLQVSADNALRLPLDRGLIKQALLNILLNSVQAMPEGGMITITCGFKENDQVMLHIEDSGIGMDGETIAKAFEPFFSTKDRGTGLGMSITAGIIHAHNGTIEVQSEPGKGTELTIMLPRTVKS